MCASAQVGQKRVSESLELEFQAVVNYQKWGLKLKPGSSARGTRALNRWAIFPSFIMR